MGLINYDTKTIKTSSLLSGVKETKEVLYHEIGHLCNINYKISEDKEFLRIFEQEKYSMQGVSEEIYCIEKINEYVSECYMLFILNPYKLKRYLPQSYEYFNSLFNNYYK